MNVLIVSGIWPPDVGGPASHAPALAAFLAARGNPVEVVTTASARPPPRPYPVFHVSRSLPPGVRHAAVAALVARRARRADVVYATTMLRRAALGAAAARRPLVVKVATDDVYERARRMGLYEGSLDDFQTAGGGARVWALRRSRMAALARAGHVFFPSSYLRSIALGWGLAPARTSVLPNPRPVMPDLESRDALRARFGMTGPTLVLAGRLTAQKAVSVALDALARIPDVSLLVVGDGPDLAALGRESADRGLEGRVRFLGGRSRSEVVSLFYAADAALLSSSWENFPHTVVEALAAGTPVISTAVGGVPEVVRDGENGLLVPAGDPEALAGAIERFLGDDRLSSRLRAAAAESVSDYAPERLFARIESVLEEVIQS
jgi:glycosyltransferase involved in cell wall biosynthesis